MLYLYNYIDTVMLGVLRGDVETGLYSAAYRLYEGLSNIPAVLQAVLMPRLALHFVQDRGRHRRLARTGLLTAVLVAVPTTAGALFVAGPIVRLLFGEAYVLSAGVFRILSLGFLFVFPLFVLHAEAISSNAERLLLRTAVIGCVIQCVPERGTDSVVRDARCCRCDPHRRVHERCLPVCRTTPPPPG